MAASNGTYFILDFNGERVMQCVASESGATISSVEVTEPDLEAVFLHLTGKALRD